MRIPCGTFERYNLYYLALLCFISIKEPKKKKWKQKLTFTWLGFSTNNCTWLQNSFKFIFVLLSNENKGVAPFRLYETLRIRNILGLLWRFLSRLKSMTGFYIIFEMNFKKSENVTQPTIPSDMPLDLLCLFWSILV